MHIRDTKELMYKKKKRKWDSRNWTVFIIATIGMVVVFVFQYAPMFGIILAFKDADYTANILRGLVISDWIGFDNFEAFLNDVDFWDVISNTLGLNLIMLLINFPAPIIFALLINEIKHGKYKKFVQSTTTFPHFISWAIFGGIIIALTDQTTGIVNQGLAKLGVIDNPGSIYLMGEKYIWLVIILSSLLKSVGWGSIIYLAAITKIPPDLYEAAEIDGANRLQKAIHITLPSIAATITVFLLLNISRILNNSFEQFNSFQNVVNIGKSEVLTTYVYRMGFTYRRWSYATAIGIFEAIVSLLLLIISNYLSKKTTGRGIF